jgi:hypothetical protein
MADTSVSQQQNQDYFVNIDGKTDSGHQSGMKYHFRKKERSEGANNRRQIPA